MISLILKYIVKSKFHQFEKMMKSPFKTQNDILIKLIKKNKNTVFGKKHNFKEILSYNDYTKHVPIQTYEDLFPYLELTLKGANNKLCSDNINRFAQTSGTTKSQRKLIPVSKK